MPTPSPDDFAVGVNRPRKEFSRDIGQDWNIRQIGDDLYGTYKPDGSNHLLAGGGTPSGTPGVHINRNAAESVASNIGEAINWTTEVFDNDGMWAIGSPAFISINTPGWWTLTLNVSFAARNDFEVCWAAIRRAPASAYLALNNSKAAIVGVADCQISVGCTRKFTAGQSVVCEVFQRNTAAAAVNLLASAEYTPVFTAVFVGS